MTKMSKHHDDDTVYTSQDVTEMVLRLAHEVRNPLAIIKSSIQLVRRLNMSAEAASPHFESALKHIERIHRTMQEIERFVSLQAGTSSAVRVEDAMAKALTSVHGQAEENDLRLTNNGGPEVRVAIDPEQFQVILGKLLENALCFSGAGGSITTSWESEEQMVHIHIGDEGPGVSEEHAPHILRPFYSTLTQGTGLGLNVVQRICTLVGGSLEWENRTETGCRFTIVLKEV